MTATTVSTEQHKSHRVGWLRAAVLGANDGIVSTASLVVGVAAANTGRSNVLIAGIAGLVSGAISMAAGDELGISEITTARPVQAALTSAATFSVGAVMPLATVAIVPFTSAIAAVTVLSLIFLAALGMIAATAGGASAVRGAVRVTDSGRGWRCRCGTDWRDGVRSSSPRRFESRPACA